MTILGNGARVLSRTFEYSGRAGRIEFWWWARLLFGVQLVLFAILTTIEVLTTRSVPDLPGLLLEFATVAVLVTVFAFFPTLALVVRRLHDTGRSGWWVLLWFVVPSFAWVIFLVIGFTTFARGFGGGDPSLVPAIVSLGVATAVSVVVALWTLWCLNRDGDNGPNRFGDAAP